MSTLVFAFEVWLHRNEHRTIINAQSAGQAKYRYIQSLDGCCGGTSYLFRVVRCRKVGAPHTSEQFVRNAKYRGMPSVRCGARVRVGEATGVIVGNNSSANFDVVFDKNSPRYAGRQLNVHPNECVFEAADAATGKGRL